MNIIKTTAEASVVAFFITDSIQKDRSSYGTVFFGFNGYFTGSQTRIWFSPRFAHV